jgi:hypothetical protein
VLDPALGGRSSAWRTRSNSIGGRFRRTNTGWLFSKSIANRGFALLLNPYCCVAGRWVRTPAAAGQLRGRSLARATLRARRAGLGVQDPEPLRRDHRRDLSTSLPCRARGDRPGHRADHERLARALRATSLPPGDVPPLLHTDAAKSGRFLGWSRSQSEAGFVMGYLPAGVGYSARLTIAL